eukprot:scaffold97351_cov51-Phaeocystis_antarctica.AAC.1
MRAGRAGWVSAGEISGDLRPGRWVGWPTGSPTGTPCIAEPGCLGAQWSELSRWECMPNPEPLDAPQGGAGADAGHCQGEGSPAAL